RSLRPVNPYQVFAKHADLAKSSLLHQLAELHIVHYRESQTLICADLLIHASTNQVERAHSDVITRIRIAYLPWPMPKSDQRLEERDHHPLSTRKGQHGRKQDKMIHLVLLFICDRATQSICAKHHIGIREKNPVATSLSRTGPHCVCLAQPFRWKLFYVNHPNRHTAGLAGNSLDNLSGPVFRAVIHDDYFVIWIVKVSEGSQRGFDRERFVAGGNDDCDLQSRVSCPYRDIPFRPGDLRNLGHSP